jgi:hypothetical protein
MPSMTSESSSQPFRTWEMVEWLRERLEVPAELGEAFLGVWTWAIRYAVLNLAGQESDFLCKLRNGEAELPLSAELAPPGWRDEDLRAQLALQTGLPDEASQELLKVVATKLQEIEGRAFEPVGEFSVRRGKQPGFTLRFRPDFLEPVLDEPAHLVDDVRLSDIQAQGPGVVLNGELPFGGHVPRRFDVELRTSEARELLGSNGADLVSLKVRPLRIWPVYEPEDFLDGYVYDADYAAVEPFLSSRLERLREGSIGRGKAAVYALEGSSNFAFVEHETGPEIIAPVSDLAGPALAEPVVEIIQATLRAVDRSNRAREEKDNKLGRHFHVEAVTLEERREDFARMLAVFPLPLSEGSLAVLRPLLAKLGDVPNAHAH